MKLKVTLLLATLLACVSAVSAQKLTPITWDASVTANSTDNATVTISAKIEKGWHLYGFNLPDDGPNSTSIVLNLPEGVTADGEITPSRQPVEKFDPIFSLKLAWWDDDVTFTQKLKITDGKTHEIDGYVYFQGCNDQTCISPSKTPFSISVGTGPEAAEETPVTDSVAAVTTSAVQTAKVAGNDTDWWAPVEITDSEAERTSADNPWWIIFLWGFGGGLIALLTPCVWPMIPMTVSFFLKKSGNRRKAVTDALIYGISIVVIYLSLGLAITAIFGASKLNELSTNAIFNIAFFLLLVIFAISFFGGFDITLQVEQFGRRQGGTRHRPAEHLLHGLHPGARFLLLHRSHHRHPACRGGHYGQSCRSGHRNARIRHRPCPPLFAVCHLPVMAQRDAPFRRLAQFGESGAGIPGTRPVAQIPVGGRPGLRLGTS